ncbi:hypothetical protein [Pedobacter sp. GR22-6]|uniref:hypothetical protein n=1 Tax=Pedobacter sp. GR22-6 TaxID=3127957 RepID=UPI00307EB8E9
MNHLPMENTAFNDEICMQRSCLESFAYKLTEDLENTNDYTKGAKRIAYLVRRTLSTVF